MQHQYLGREVAASAIEPLVSALRAANTDTELLPPEDALREPGLRLRWSYFLTLLNIAERTFSPEELCAIGASGLPGQQRKRLRIARACLTLEDAYRFIVYPHRVIDYGCLHATVETRPGWVHIVALVEPGYSANAAFFHLMRGAAQALPTLFGVKDAVVEGSVSERHLDYTIRFTPKSGWLQPLRRVFSNAIRILYCALNTSNLQKALADRT